MDVRTLEGKKILFVSSEAKEVKPVQEWGRSEGIEPVMLKGEGQKTPLAAIDSSVIHLAETEDGSVYGAKVSLVVNKEKGRALYRAGPLILYINEGNVKSFSGLFSNKVPTMLFLIDHQATMKGIRVILERTMAQLALNHLDEGIVLLDGPLRLSIFEPYNASLDLLLATNSKTILIGMSKASRLKPVNRIASNLAKIKGSCYVEITELIKSIVRPSLGRSFLVKLQDRGLVFRVDVPSHVEPEYVLSAMKHSDVLTHGYPESLKIAHLLSVFTMAEVAGLKGIIASKAGEVLVVEDLRKVVLGSLKI
jgi:hypothetical protein